VQKGSSRGRRKQKVETKAEKSAAAKMHPTLESALSENQYCDFKNLVFQRKNLKIKLRNASGFKKIPDVISENHFPELFYKF
jgi:hypothetical protein